MTDEINLKSFDRTALLFGYLGVGMLPAYGYLSALLILCSGLIFVNWDEIKKNWLFLVLFNQYFVISIVLNIFHDGSWAENPNNPFFVICILSSFPIVSLYGKGRLHYRFVFYPVVCGVLLSIGLLIWQYTGSSCRVQGFTFNPLGTSALFLLVGFFVVGLGHQLCGAPRLLSWIILGLIIYVIIGPAGSRMPFFSALTGVFLFAIYLFKSDSLKTSIRFMVTVFSVFILAITISMVFKDCGLLSRLKDNLNTVVLILTRGDEVVVERGLEVSCDASAPSSNSLERSSIEVTFSSTVENMSQDAAQNGEPYEAPLDQVLSIGMPSSEGHRFILWLTALERWKDQKLFGFGNSNEKQILNLACTGQPHAHNQLLSWLVSGGILLFFSGLVFVSAAILGSKNMALPALVTFPVALSQLTDSLMNLHQMIILLSFALPAVLSLSHRPD